MKPYSSWQGPLRVYALVMFIAACAVFVTQAHAQSGYPKRQDTYINDYANLLDNDSEARLRKWLTEFKVKHGIEMTVVTIRSIADYRPGVALEPFATTLFNIWGVGDATTNRGIMLLVARNDRKVRLELGRGFAAADDKKAKGVIDEHIIPAFKQDHYQEGIEKGVRGTINTLTGDWPTGAEPNLIERLNIRIDPTVLLVLGGLGMGGVGVVFFWRMQHTCPDCGKVALNISSTVLSSATYSSEGEKEVVRTCSNCGFHDMRLVAIAMLSHSSDDDSSSSSSSSSSSGGGSSSSGGASGSW